MRNRSLNVESICGRVIARLNRTAVAPVSATATMSTAALVLISMLLAVCMAICAVPKAAFAEDQLADDTPPLMSEDAPSLVTDDTPSLVGDTSSLVDDASSLTTDDSSSLVTDDAPSLVADGASLLEADNNPLLVAQDTNRTIPVTVGFPSETVMTKDNLTYLSYTDDFFESSAEVYNDALGYASVCLAAASDNSNTQGSNYAAKTINVHSFLQQIGCQDITFNAGYLDKPTLQSNIGVAIGWKSITVGGKQYKLFVVGSRGGGYEEEWAMNMLLGTSGDHQGFREARDSALAFIMPYIRSHTQAGDNVKIWMSGYCRGGTTMNMAGAWLNKWIYERNNGQPYADYNDSYNADHSVVGDYYDSTLGRNTRSVSFPCDYVDASVNFSESDVYCYPVNCPQGADQSDVEAHEGLMVGIHNLINPDDWFPQVPMAWFGFARYGQSRDHDITGYYETDGTLSARNRPAITTDAQRVFDMIERVRGINKEGGYDAAWFRQYYFEKLRLSIVYDKSGYGNRFVSIGEELKYNQGAYYEEFFRFLLKASDCDSRATYVSYFQDDLAYFMRVLMGPEIEVREKVGGELGRQFLAQFQVVTGLDLSTSWGKFGALVAIPYLMSEESTELQTIITNAFGETFDKLDIAHDDDRDESLAETLAKMIKGAYADENEQGTLNFYHLVTMYKTVSGISQTHAPEVSLSWFAQSAENPFLTESEQGGDQGDGVHLITCRVLGGTIPGTIVRRTGDVLGQLPYDGKVVEAGFRITGWTTMDGEDIDATYVLKESDPSEMALVAIVQPLGYRTLLLHGNYDDTFNPDANDVVATVTVYEDGATIITGDERYMPMAEVDDGVVHYTAPTRAGYTFLGWQTTPNSDELVAYFDPDDTIWYDDANAGDDNLYAVWIDNAVYTLHYHSNDPANEITVTEEHLVDGNGTVPISDQISDRSGYTFAGWNTKPDGTGVSVGALTNATPTALGLPSTEAYHERLGLSPDIYEYETAASNATVDLYAQWVKNEPPSDKQDGTPSGKQNVTPTPTQKSTTSTTTQGKSTLSTSSTSSQTRASLPKTGDNSQAAIPMLLGVAMVALVLGLFGKWRVGSARTGLAADAEGRNRR